MQRALRLKRVCVVYYQIPYHKNADRNRNFLIAIFIYSKLTRAVPTLRFLSIAIVTVVVYMYIEHKKYDATNYETIYN